MTFCCMCTGIVLSSITSFPASYHAGNRVCNPQRCVLKPLQHVLSGWQQTMSCCCQGHRYEQCM
jgi:hypothetical protein